jgi:glutamine amidotransferase
LSTSTSVDVIDYDMGNLRSISNALASLDADVRLIRTPSERRPSSHLLLPGVGAFGASMANLRAAGLDELILEHATSGIPFMGICLGFQVMFERGTEAGDHQGLGLFKGTVARFDHGLHIPHTGWNELHATRPHPVTADLGEGRHVYFVHSYRAEGVPEEDVLTTSDYGGEFVAGVARDAVAGFQFHPEKSGHTGLSLLRAWLAWRP